MNRRIPETPSAGALGKPLPHWSNLMLMLMLMLLIGGGGWLYYQDRRAALHRQARQELNLVADLQARSVAHWLRERQGDAAVFFEAQLGVPQQRFVADPELPAARQATLKWMGILRDHYGYRDIILVNAELQPILSLTGAATPPSHDKPLIRKAIDTNRVVFSDLRMAEGTSQPRIDIVVPLQPNAWGSRTGALLLQIDPAKDLFPLIDTWPTPSTSAETLLVRRDGDQIAFLSPLRRHPDERMVHLPLNTPRLPAALALQGATGQVEGFDYQGVPVLAAMRVIEGSDWRLVAKIDQDEVLAPLDALWWGTTGTTLLLMLLTGLGAWTLWSREQQRLLRQGQADLEAQVAERTEHLSIANRALEGEMARRSHAQRQLEQTRARLQHVLDASPATLYALDLTGGDDRFVSDNIRQLIGYTSDQVLASPDFWRDHLHPEDRDAVLARQEQ